MSGTQRPLFLVHGGGVEDLHFSVLVAQLDPDIPLHALPALAPDDSQPRTLEERATGLLDGLRAVQPRGPYRLAGGAFGGVLAYELAIQLIGLDERVEFLALIDTELPRRLDLLPQLEQVRLGADLDLEQAQAYALAHYRVFPIPLPVHLFIASEPARSGYLGWDRVLPEARLRVVSVPGKQGHLMQVPYVQALGGALDDALLTLPAPALANARAAGHQALLTIQSGRAGQAPVFCVPGAGDGVTSFIGLADALGPAWPMHGLQPRGLDGSQVPFASVETAAAVYLETIEAQYADAPVHLIGHSFGGWIAFEMASRLRARGRPVASLTLIDSEAPQAGGVLGRPYTATAVLERLIAAMEAATGRMLGIDPAVLGAQDDAAQVRLLHAGMVGAGLLPPRAAPEIMAGPLRAFGSALRTRYQPQHGYEGPVRLVRAEDLAPGRVGQHEMSEGWRRYAPNIEVWQGPGHHFSILKPPHVQRLAHWWANPDAPV
ncbi:MAG: alpha/beta fold hydrolase [Pseudomonadota bacterium]